MDDAELNKKLQRIDEINKQIKQKVAEPVIVRQGWSRVRKWIAEIALVVGLTGVLYAGIANNAAHIANQRAQAACQQYKYVGESPASKVTSALGYHIIIADRLGYVTAHCHIGPLKSVDPVVQRWMAANPTDALVLQYNRVLGVGH